MIAHIEFDDKSIEERIEKTVGLLRAAQMEIAGLLALPIKVGSEEKTPAEKAGAADFTDEETKRACRIATLRGLLNFHRRSTMACRTEDGTSPGELIADMYTDALEAAIEALEDYEPSEDRR